MRVAAIADVHGNLIALEAVLAALSRAAPDLIVNLGDLVSGPFDPAGSADAQMALGCPTLAGNHERQLLEGGSGASDSFARPRLTSGHLDWIAGLPKTIALLGGDVFACHGSPAGGDNDYLLERVSDGGVRLDSDAAIRARLAGIGEARLVLCGHTHTPRIARVGEVLVVNPGSVGMPCYRDETHVVENGAPHARYAILDHGPAGWSAALHAATYDYETAARQAEAAGRPEVAYSARTGWLMPK